MTRNKILTLNPCIDHKVEMKAHLKDKGIRCRNLTVPGTLRTDKRFRDTFSEDIPGQSFFIGEGPLQDVFYVSAALISLFLFC